MAGRHQQGNKTPRTPDGGAADSFTLGLEYLQYDVHRLAIAEEVCCVQGKGKGKGEGLMRGASFLQPMTEGEAGVAAALHALCAHLSHPPSHAPTAAAPACLVDFPFLMHASPVKFTSSSVPWFDRWAWTYRRCGARKPSSSTSGPSSSTPRASCRGTTVHASMDGCIYVSMYLCACVCQSVPLHSIFTVTRPQTIEQTHSYEGMSPDLPLPVLRRKTLHGGAEVSKDTSLSR